jgi:hypothetical protein
MNESVVVFVLELVSVAFTAGTAGTILHLLEIALGGVAPIADWDPMATTAAALRSTVVSVDLAALPLAGRMAFARLHAVKSDADVLSTGIV